MPLSAQFLDKLAEQLSPAIDLLLPPAAIAGLPPLPARNDVAGLRAWFAALPDADVLRALAALPKHEIVTTAHQALSSPVLPIPPVAVDAPPFITSRFVAIVDRVPVWDEILSLEVSDKRILLLKGDPRMGKSHARWLVQERCDRLGYAFLYVDLEDLQTVERAVTLGLNPQLAQPITVEGKHAANTADVAWARSIARAVFQRIRAEHRGHTPWLVFDHFDRMPMAGQDEAGAFFNTLIDLVARQPTIGPDAPHAMRLVLIDIREVPGDARLRTIIRGVDKVTREHIERFVRGCKPTLRDEEVTTIVDGIVRALREKTYMADLGEQIASFMETL